MTRVKLGLHCFRNWQCVGRHFVQFSQEPQHPELCVFNPAGNILVLWPLFPPLIPASNETYSLKRQPTRLGQLVPIFFSISSVCKWQWKKDNGLFPFPNLGAFSVPEGHPLTSSPFPFFHILSYLKKLIKTHQGMWTTHPWAIWGILD